MDGEAKKNLQAQLQRLKPMTEVLLGNETPTQEDDVEFLPVFILDCIEHDSRF